MSSTNNKKGQVSFSVPKDYVQGLDRWISFQKERRGFEIDRSHVVSVLLRRFLEKNPIPVPPKNDAKFDRV